MSSGIPSPAPLGCRARLPSMEKEVKVLKKTWGGEKFKTKSEKKIEKKLQQPATKNHCTERRVVVLVGFPFPCVHEGGRHSFTALPKSGNWANIPKIFRKTKKKMANLVHGAGEQCWERGRVKKREKTGKKW